MNLSILQRYVSDRNSYKQCWDDKDRLADVERKISGLINIYDLKGLPSFAHVLCLSITIVLDE